MHHNVHFSPLLIHLAGDEGFEPPNARTRTWCLTTWRIPSELSLVSSRTHGTNFSGAMTGLKAHNTKQGYYRENVTLFQELGVSRVT